MKKHSILVITALAACTALFATACGSTTENTAATQSTQATTTAATDAQTTSAPQATTKAAQGESTTQASKQDGYHSAMESSFPFLKAGTWLSKNSGAYRYFFFQSDGATGSLVDPETGMGVSFTYENDDDKTIFHLGAVDDRSPAVVKQSDETHAFLEWDDGTKDTLTYVSADTADSFTYFTNEDLCKMAISYYAKATGEDVSAMQAAAETNDDATVTIQLYQNLGDHNSNADWYTVDRVTAIGTNQNDERIDLKR